ncbi:hypothetical protein FT643_17045 [Ketobacter sp. MCCC 1A13808]|uniref:YybH family protein n=1 Tax=Ketobacter sp. MCCC 1A13808 TaxID=2602738 RepID=UPI000F121BEF|nr:nuclear transport factor 2 family protein [Ketobacter sp. MCCC 1A13808]MVF13850.1 hypothetical protein [Ketobacter sp. MCCC 1A13808]RLP54901.1 MAG: hypothetical protein D6160_08815 [Ketobacter sp.]
MFAGSIEDRTLIRERYGAYSDAVFQQDAEAWLANFSDAAVWEIFGKKIQGKSMLKAQWDGLWKNLERMAFFSEIGSIVAHDNSATARLYCREILLLKTGSVKKITGCYEDELIKVNGVWLYSRRCYSVLINEAGPS